MKSINQSVPNKYQDKYSDSQFNYNWPPDEVPQSKKKKKDWCKMIPVAIWSTYCRGASGLPYYAPAGSGKLDYATLRLYAEGNQPVDQYKQIIGHETKQNQPDKTDTQRFMYTNISWANQSVIPKYRRAIVQNLMDSDVKFKPKGVDQNSIDARTRYKNWLWERSSNPFYAEIYKALNMDPNAELPFVPADKIELEIFSTKSLELTHEHSVRKVIDQVFVDNQWDDIIKRQLLEDLFDIDIAMVETKVAHNGEIEFEYCDPEYTIIPASKSKNYEKMPWYGKVVYMPVKELRKAIIEAGEYEGEDTFIKQIQGYFRGNTTYSKSIISNAMDKNDSHGVYEYDEFNIPVLFGNMRSYNTDVFSERTTESGAVDIVKRNLDYDRNDDTVKTSKFTYEMWYKCAWVIGTQLFFDYGPKDYVKRGDGGKTYPGLTVFRHGNNSFVNQFVPIEDDLEIITKKFMIAWKNARPNGFALFWDSLTDISYENEKIHPLELLQLLVDRGILILNSTLIGQDGVKQMSGIIQEINGGLGVIMDEYITSFRLGISKIDEIIGASPTLTGDAPNPGQLVRTTEISQMQSLKSIEPLFEGYAWLKKQSYQKAIYDMQNLARYNPKGFSKVYKNFGTNTIQKIMVGVRDVAHTYELYVTKAATTEQKRLALEYTNQAAQKGAITYSDAMLIQQYIEDDDIEFVRMLLDYRMKKREQAAAQQQQALIESNGEEQRKSLEEKGKVDAQVAQAKGQAQENVERVIGEMDMMLERLKAALAQAGAEKESDKDDKKPKKEKV